MLATEKHLLILPSSFIAFILLSTSMCPHFQPSVLLPVPTLSLPSAHNRAQVCMVSKEAVKGFQTQKTGKNNACLRSVMRTYSG